MCSLVEKNWLTGARFPAEPTLARNPDVWYAVAAQVVALCVQESLTAQGSGDDHMPRGPALYTVRMSRIERRFEIIATHAAELLGRGLVCVVALLLVGVGFLLLPVEVVNVAISVATLVLLFVLQSSQNKDSLALHVKLDELITRLNEPRDEVAVTDQVTRQELEDLRAE